MEPKTKPKDERTLAAQAAALMTGDELPALSSEEPVNGQPLPEGFVNPQPGEQGHLCIDPRGVYRSDWVCLKIHKANENMPQRQYFNHNGRSWLVIVGQWVDVPPQVMTLLSLTEQQVISMDITKVNLMVDRGVPRVVDTVPRFGYTSIASS